MDKQPSFLNFNINSSLTLIFIYLNSVHAFHFLRCIWYGNNQCLSVRWHYQVQVWQKQKKTTKQSTTKCEKKIVRTFWNKSAANTRMKTFRIVECMFTWLLWFSTYEELLQRAPKMMWGIKGKRQMVLDKLKAENKSVSISWEKWITIVFNMANIGILSNKQNIIVIEGSSYIPYLALGFHIKL